MEIWRLWMMFGVYLLYIDGHSGWTIPGCQQGQLDIEEGTNHSFTSDPYPWKVSDIYGNIFCDCSSYYRCELVIYFGVSEYLYSCNKSSNTYVTTRDSARLIMWEYSWIRTHCSLKITATPLYKNDSCDVSISNWTVTGSCNITGMYSSDNHYTCRWREQTNNKEEFGGWNVLESYAVNNKRLYMRGVCSFTRPISFLNGIYTYIMSVSPGSDAYYNNTINIASPDQVQLNHSCPSFVLEGSSVVCTCNASTTGSPPGLLAWYEMTDATLLLTNVSRNTSGKQFTCRLEWGSNGAIKATISYMLTVAYGPSDVIINRIAETADDQSGIIRFICSAISFYPSVMFRWNIACENETVYTHFSVCSINITHRVDLVVIECTANNTYFPQVSFSRVYNLTIEEREPESKESSAQCVNTVIVGGVGAAAIVLLIIAAVLVVCIIKRQRGMAKKKENPLSHLYAIFKRQKSQVFTDRQSASVDEIYSIADSTTADHGVDNAAFNETIHSSGTRHVTYDNNYVTQEIGGHKTAMKPLTKPMPAIERKDNCQNLSESVYDSGLMPACMDHNYEDLSPKGFKASQFSDISYARAEGCNKDESIYENVGN